MPAVVLVPAEAEVVEEEAPVAEAMLDAAPTATTPPTFLLPIATTYPTWLFSSCKYKMHYFLATTSKCHAFTSISLFIYRREYIFDLDNLCMDTFVRSYMDEAGFVPLPLLCTYQNVAAYGAPYFDVVERLNELTAERKIEFDPSNETVRLKVGWENVSILSIWIFFVICIDHQALFALLCVFSQFTCTYLQFILSHMY